MAARGRLCAGRLLREPATVHRVAFSTAGPAGISFGALAALHHCHRRDAQHRRLPAARFSRRDRREVALQCRRRALHHHGGAAALQPDTCRIEHRRHDQHARRADRLDGSPVVRAVTPPGCSGHAFSQRMVRTGPSSGCRARAVCTHTAALRIDRSARGFAESARTGTACRRFHTGAQPVVRAGRHDGGRRSRRENRRLGALQQAGRSTRASHPRGAARHGLRHRTSVSAAQAAATARATALWTRIPGRRPSYNPASSGTPAGIPSQDES